MIKSFLINLEKDKERLAFVTKNFEVLGLCFERINAVDGRTFSDQSFQDFQSLRPKNNTPWRRGQMGCFLSHFHVWELVANGEEDYCAIFEDDIHISQDLKLILNDLQSIPTTTDIIRLETSTNRVLLNTSLFITGGKRKAYKVQSTTWCTGSYILSKEAAKKLIAVPDKFHHLSDIFLFNFEVSKIARELETFQFNPAFCTQNKHLLDNSHQFTSNIEIDETRSTRFRSFIAQFSLVNILQSLMKTARGYKRIGFQ
jgi:glycosyl transferase family 25